MLPNKVVIVICSLDTTKIVPARQLPIQVARQRYETATESEKGGVPRMGEPPLWLKLLHRLEVHRLLSRFDHLLGSTMGTGKVGYIGGDSSSVFFGDIRSRGHDFDCAAISSFVMLEGKHHALFHMSGDIDNQCIRIGITKPVHINGWDENRRRDYWPFRQP